MINPSNAVNNSTIGQVSHRPVIPHRADNKNAIGMISASPLKMDRICAGRAFSIEVKKVAKTVLYPINGMAVKYSFSPVTAICCSRMLFSRLNAAVIGCAKTKIIS